MHQLSSDELIRELEATRAELHKLQTAAEELNRVKENLKESEERYRAVFEYTGTAMIVIDEEMTITMANHKLEEIAGYAHEESYKKRKWTEVVVPEDIERMRDYHVKRRADPQSVPSEYEFGLIDKDGNVRDMLLTATMLPGSGSSLVSLVDITRVKHSERALRESERRYRELFENATDIVFTIDLDGNFTSANYSALSTFGYEVEDILKTNIRQLIDPAWQKFAMEKLAEKRSLSAASDRYELLTRTRDGKPVWVELSTRLIREFDRSVGIQGIARDITERKRQEEELHESRLRFKETADLLPGIICEIDTSMNLTYVNEMGLTSFGYTAEDFTRGVSVWDLVPENDQERFKQDVFNVTHGDYGNPKLYELLRKDGSRLQLIINSAPIVKNTTITGIRSCLIDISDRIRAENQLRESEERFRSVYAGSPIGIALYDTNGKLLDHNDSFNRMFEATEMPDRLFSAAGINPSLRRKLQPGIPLNTETELTVNTAPAESKRWFEWYISTLSSLSAHPQMYLVQVQEITSRKEAQEARLRKEREATARAEAMVAGLRRELREYTGFNNIISRSPDMKQIFDILPEVAQATATVLVNGDSGTGKELIARSLHELSSRKDKPFIVINCSALPDNLLESELFGYKAGAFTDAKKDKPGRFALAENGTIFLDEIGDISMAMQVKLLRVLQEKVYEPLGGTHPLKTNARVIAATNKKLSDMVAKGLFREDLFYRINVVTIHLPALRKRRCDIPLLCNHFIERFNTRYDKSINGLTETALQLLLAHDFPGNIRELENVIEHAFIFCKDPVIDAVHLPISFREQCNTAEETAFAGIRSFEELEQMYIKSILNKCNWNKVAAAERLGIHKATLFRKLKQLGIANN
jgi:PAS domain S-box-containing protein